jgi:Leucine-rich repeat (LRR) protein
MSSKDLGKPLTTDLVFTKTKSDSLQNIKNLNLWGNDLEDLRLIEKMPNLEVVSLSVNRINSLRDFATCQKLQVLLHSYLVIVFTKKLHNRPQVD